MTLKKNPTKVERIGGEVFVIVTTGFSAVILPKPTCPPMIEATTSIDYSYLGGGWISLSLYGPWRNDLDKKKFKVNVEVPGLRLEGPSEVAVPETIKYLTDADALSGRYYFMIKGGDTLPYKGWFDVLVQ